jgi:DNA-binding HxlR family transcriptional regulator
MAPVRYPQFCALARAAELLGERWTLLIIRELLLSPKRFSDLRARLDGISTSVLAERLARLEDSGLLRRTFMEPPAASTVYELTEDGRALKPTVFALIRWGGRYLMPQRPGERVEPDWMRLAMAAYVPKGPTPARSFNIRIPADEGEAIIHVRGGPGGTAIAAGPAPADVEIAADFPTVLGLTVGLINPSDALKQGAIQAEGDLTALPAFPQLFDTTAGRGGDDVGP